METPALDAIEEVVAQVWCATFGLERLPPQANIFSLGADSMTAVMIAANLSERLGFEVMLADLVDAPGITEFVTWAAGVVQPEHGE